MSPKQSPHSTCGSDCHRRSAQWVCPSRSCRPWPRRRRTIIATRPIRARRTRTTTWQCCARRWDEKASMSDFTALMLHEVDGKVVPRIEQVDDAALPQGDVTVAVEYSTLNYKDGMILSGLGRLVRKYPHIPGVDFAGTVAHSDSPE